MALSNFADWNEAKASAGKGAFCGTACGAGKPDEKPSSACGASKPSSACGASGK